MPQGIRKERLGRHRPVSCNLCRSRKLRCNRQFPCSNCTARGVDCQLYASKAPDLPSKSSKDEDFNRAEHDILSRLQRLEDIILSPRASAPQDSTELVEVAHALTNLRREAPTQHTESDAEGLQRERVDQSWMVSSATSLPPSETDSF